MSPRAVAIGVGTAVLALWIGVLGWVADNRHRQRETIAEDTRARATMLAAQLGREAVGDQRPVLPEPADLLRTAAALGVDQVLLVRDDGVVLAATPDAAAAIGTLVTIPKPQGGARSLGFEPGRSDRLVARAAAQVPERDMFVAIARRVAADSASRAGEIVAIALSMLLTAMIGVAGLLLRRRAQPTGALLQEGVERMADGFLLLDPDERLVAWNARYLKLVPAAADLVRPGLGYETLLRDLMRRMRPEIPEGAAFEATIADLLRGHRDPTGPWEIATPAGRQLEVEETRLPGGGTVAIYRDITDRRRQEAALHKALQAERDTALLHRRFVTMAGHEFRTPLAVIDGAAQRLLATVGESAPGAAGRLERIRGAVAQLAILIDRLLSGAKVEDAQSAPEMKSADLCALLLESCEAQRKISPRFDIRLRAPDGPVEAEIDRRLLGQVVAHLLSNAVKYSGSARHVDVELERSSDDHALIRVTDRGVGIPAEEIGRLFTRFYRASTAQGTLGTGTSLHLARQIVELHGGRIDVESTLGSGTTVTLRLPLHRRRAAA